MDRLATVVRLVGWASAVLLCIALAGCNPLQSPIRQHFVVALAGAVNLHGTAEFAPRGVFDCSAAALQVDSVDFITVSGTPVSWELGVYGQSGHQQFDPATDVNGVSTVMIGNDGADPRNTYSNDGQEASGSITVQPDGAGVIRLDNWQNSDNQGVSGTISWTCSVG